MSFRGNQEIRRNNKIFETYSYDYEKLRSLNAPVDKLMEVHTEGNEAKQANSEVAYGLETELLLARGTRIMLTTNIWTAAGLVNRAIGIIQGILYGEDQGHPFLQ
jgi:hypothetical protein